jgi:hypothetical protein
MGEDMTYEEEMEMKFEAQRDEELDVYRQSFEDFLVEKHAEQYVGLDDNMVEDCEDWISFKDVDDITKLAEEYGKKCFKQGRRTGR